MGARRSCGWCNFRPTTARIKPSIGRPKHAIGEASVSAATMLFGGSSKEGIGGKSRRAIFLNPQYSDGCQRGEGERREFLDPPKQLSQLLSFPPHPRLSSKPSARS